MYFNFQKQNLSEKNKVKWACFNIKRNPKNTHLPNPPFRDKSKTLKRQNRKEQRKQFVQEKKKSHGLDISLKKSKCSKNSLLLI